MRIRVGWLAALAAVLLPLPAQAAVTIAFWSRDFGIYFPHAFFTLRGTPDRGGAAIDASYGFTARAVTPALLFGNVGGKVEEPKRGYMEGSHVRFTVTLSDAQYDAVVALIREWDQKTGDSTYNLGKRNCVHFIREAARRSGLAGLDQPKLMKKPGSFLLAVEQANTGQVTVVEQMGKQWLAELPPIHGVAPVTVPTGTPGEMPEKKKKKKASEPVG